MTRHQINAQKLQSAAISIAHDAKADFWLTDYGNHWTGAAIPKPTGASSCAGYDEACEAIASAIDEMRDDIMARAKAINARRLEAGYALLAEVNQP